MKKVLVLLSFIAGVICTFGVSRLDFSTHLGSFDQASLSSIATQGMDAPCEYDFQCQDKLLCHAGACRPLSNLGEANESCSRREDCRSGVCEQFRCKPTIEVAADNGDSCRPSSPMLCRSGTCGDDYKCRGSTRFGAFPRAACEVDSDCLSFRCGPTGRCDFAPGPVTCAEVGAQCGNNMAACCSGSCISGTCEAKPSSRCTNSGECAGQVGRVCAANGQFVRNDFQCCSGRQAGGTCVADFSRNDVPCRVTSDCRTGFTCNMKLNLCRPKDN